MMADSKMSAAQGVACFGTAGLHSKVFIVLCMMEFEGKFEENTVDTSYCLCFLKSSVFLTWVLKCPWLRAAGPTVCMCVLCQCVLLYV